MADRDNTDGSEDVADFLERIRELGDQRVKEDEERARKLEEEILQGRKERQARRAERARSISPTKDSPLNSSFSSAQQLPDSPTPTSAREDKMNTDAAESSPKLSSRAMGSPLPEPTKPHPPPSSAGLSRSGTLSWQQRPSSRGSPTVRSRPLSAVATENSMRSPRETPEATSPSSKDNTREQVASLLQGKDPSWFRQTEDRGKNSAAYRRSQDPSRASPESVRLPGLGQASSSDPASQSLRYSGGPRSPSPARAGEPVGPASNHRSTDGTFDRSQAATSPMPVLSSQRFEPPSENPHDQPASSLARSPTMSPSQGRISPDRMDRPSSPTKGLGGFVQSAMLKRSDSINKRWSAQAAAGLKRGDSVSSGHVGAVNISRAESGRISPVKPPTEMQDGSGSVATYQGSTGGERERSSDSKRWSPTKSTWLESAITKTDSPKPKPAGPTQPSWMAEINRAKQARSGAEPGSDAKEKPTIDVGPQLPRPASPHKSTPSIEASKGVQTTGHTTNENEPNVRQSSSVEPSPRPTAVKSKPETPPKKDFRGSLKSRPLPSSDGQSAEPEFKNVFGKLKKAETKNYVAPDEFKGNITRGKAALNVTGGPRPWQKKDEFKDSILKKKQEMEQGTSVVNTGNVAEAPAPAVPEALAKIGNMSSRPFSGDTSHNPSFESTQKPPAAQSPSKTESARADTTSSGKPRSAAPPQIQQPVVAKDASSLQTATPEPVKAKAAPPTKPDVTSKPEVKRPAAPDVIPTSVANRPRVKESAASDVVPSLLAKKAQVKESAAPTVASSPVASRPTPMKKESASSVRPSVALESRTSSSSSGSKLADRFNPALAGLLAKGRSGSSADPESHTGSPAEPPKQQTSQPAPAAPLTHSTKSRARGPKRRLPKTMGAAATDANEPAKSAAKETNNVKSPTLPRKVESPSLPSTAPVSPKRAQMTAKPPAALPSPSLSRSPPVLKPKPSLNEGKSSPILERQSFKDASVATGQKSNPSSPKMENAPILSKIKSSPASLPEVISPRLPSRTLEAVASPKATSPVMADQLQPKSPPTPGKKPVSLAQMALEGSNMMPAPKSAKSEVKESQPVSEAAQCLSDFFRQPLSTVAKDTFDVDTQAILQKAPTPEKIKSLRKEIWEITGDGKKTPVPTQREHILFDKSMFLCTHVFSAANGKRTTEVYLWCGNEVSSSAIEDAQLFGRNAARDVGTKLAILEQGKEPSSFFEALGGIVITRQGSPSSAASARYMLSGRRHLGHVAFDEATFSPTNLCSGFPCLVASGDGSKLFLWKGKGSGTDMVGCARLIAMDLGVTGDVIEVDEGSEPDTFWKAFGSGKPTTAPWNPSVNASWEKYVARLFTFDAARPKSGSGFLQWARRASTPGLDDEGGAVREISPFAQSDLSKEGIFVLDTFFEVFVIAGSNATSKLASFKSALFFAQEYSLLAASLEDRPGIPAGYVVLGGVPDGIRHAFRRWEDKKSPTAREDKFMDLNEALEAFNEAV